MQLPSHPDDHQHDDNSGIDHDIRRVSNLHHDHDDGDDHDQHDLSDMLGAARSLRRLLL